MCCSVPRLRNGSRSTPPIRLKTARYITTRAQAKITMPKIRGLELSGASKGTISGFSSTENVDIKVSGASRVTGDLAAGDVDFDVSGASTIRLQGMAGDMELDLSGASNAELEDLPVNDADVNLSGASRAVVNVDGRLDVNLSGASKLTYTGNHTIGDVHISGASTMQSK